MYRFIFHVKCVKNYCPINLKKCIDNYIDIYFCYSALRLWMKTDAFFVNTYHEL